MTSPQPVVPLEASKQRTALTFLKAATTLSGLLLALGTLVGVCLYLTGHVAHITHLRDLGVPADLFPRGVEWTMVNGYYAIFREWTRTLRDVPWGVLLLLGVMLSFLIWLYRLPPPQQERVSSWIEKLPTFLRSILVAVLGSAFAVSTVITLLLVGSLIALIPGLIGERAGKEAAAQDLQRFRSRHSNVPNAEVWKEDRLIMRGHFIAVSTDLVAIYDVKTDMVRIVDRAGTELRSHPHLKRSASK